MKHPLAGVVPRIYGLDVEVAGTRSKNEVMAGSVAENECEEGLRTPRSWTMKRS
jgi:hypothetical protein